MNDIKNISIVDLLPPSISKDSQILASAMAIDNELLKVTNLIDKIIIFPHIDKLDSELVNILAEQFRAPSYDTNLPIETRRQLVRNSIAWHKKKGTVGALEEIVTTIFGESKVMEWYEYGGEPHHFRIITNDINTSDNMVDQFREAAEHIKRESSKLEDVVVLLTNKFNMYYGFGLHIGDKITLRQGG